MEIGMTAAMPMDAGAIDLNTGSMDLDLWRSKTTVRVLMVVVGVILSHAGRQWTARSKSTSTTPHPTQARWTNVDAKATSRWRRSHSNSVGNAADATAKRDRGGRWHRGGRNPSRIHQGSVSSSVGSSRSGDVRGRRRWVAISSCTRRRSSRSRLTWFGTPRKSDANGSWASSLYHWHWQSCRGRVIGASRSSVVGGVF